MKLNPRALLEAARFPVQRQIFEGYEAAEAAAIDDEEDFDDEDHDDRVGAPIYRTETAAAVIVTEEAVAAARQILNQNLGVPAYQAEIDIELGDLLTVSRNAEGRNVFGRHPIGRYEDWSIDMGEGFGLRSISGTALFATRHALIEKAGQDQPLSLSERSVLAGSQAVMDELAANPDGERYGSHMVTGMFQAAYEEHFGNAQSQLDGATIARKLAADSIRARIYLIDPQNPDARAPRALDADATEGLNMLLEEAGLNRVSSDMNMFDRFTDAARQAIRGNQRLCLEVFNAITTTDVGKLGLASITTQQAAAARETLAPYMMTGEWIDEVRGRITEITGGAMPGYRAQIDVVSHEGADALIVTDTVGDMHGRAFVYGYPTAERQPIMAVGNGFLANISPEEIPSQEELARLNEALQAATTRRYGGYMEAAEVGLDDMDPYAIPEPRPEGH